MKTERDWLVLLLVLAFGCPAFAVEQGRTVYVIPVRGEISTPMAYLVRRGVKQAMEAKADLLVIDMETNGGRLDSTEDILEALNQFRGDTLTYVNRKAFSAGAFIAVGTKRIFMAPQSVIGAAAPLLMGPGGDVEALPETVEAKMTSGVRALVRTSAEKNGYNIEVIEAMIDKSRKVEIDGEVLNEKGQILTLTNVQAEKRYGGKALLSSGTEESLKSLLAQVGFSGARVVRVTTSGAERVASWLTAIGPLLLLIGIAGIYIEIKTPGFGLPGIVGITAFLLYFLGGYVAGLSGWEWAVIFLIGLGLFAAEILVLPGTIFLGLLGAGLMLTSLVMAMVDLYPGGPVFPSFDQLRGPLQRVLLSAGLASIVMMLLSRFLLKTPLMSRMVAQGASGSGSVQKRAAAHASRVGKVGLAVSALRPGGKARFENEVLDVITQGEMLQRGTAVRIVGFSGPEAVVEKAGL